MLTVLGTLFIGLIVGLVARALKPGNDGMGWIMTAVLGVAGSFLSSVLGSKLGLYQPGQMAGFLGSLVGAIVLLVVYGLVRKR